MKTLSVFLFSLALLLSMVWMADAALLDRGDGLIYDDVLDITWLQDANYLETIGRPISGMVTWDDAVAWVDQLVYAGYDDWRLPTTVDGPLEYGYDGTTTVGYNITTSEMGYMYYVNLGNLGRFDTNEDLQPGYGLNNSGPFINLESFIYWTGTEVSSNPTLAYVFITAHGEANYGFKTGNKLHAWAVRDGDVSAVPVPGAVWLLASGLVGLIGLRRKLRKA